MKLKMWAIYMSVASMSLSLLMAGYQLFEEQYNMWMNLIK